MAKEKCVGLIKRIESNGGIDHRVWIFAGTERLRRYPKIEGCDLTGIPSYGSARVYCGKDLDPRIFYKAARDQQARLEACGWSMQVAGTHYGYFTRGDLRDA